MKLSNNPKDWTIIRLSPEVANQNTLSKDSVTAFIRLGEILLSIKKDIELENAFDAPHGGLTIHDHYDRRETNSTN